MEIKSVTIRQDKRGNHIVEVLTSGDHQSSTPTSGFKFTAELDVSRRVKDDQIQHTYFNREAKADELKRYMIVFKVAGYPAEYIDEPDKVNTRIRQLAQKHLEATAFDRHIKQMVARSWGNTTRTATAYA